MYVCIHEQIFIKKCMKLKLLTFLLGLAKILREINNLD